MTYINFDLLLKLAILISVETIGLVQWMKNLISKKSKSLGKIYTFLSLLTVIGCSILNSSLVPDELSAVINLILSSLAVSQLAWDVIAKGVPRMINGMIDKYSGRSDELKKMESDPTYEGK